MRFAFLLCAVLAGCASTGAEADRETDPGLAAVLEVQNNNWLSMEVSAETAGQRLRLGRLAPGRTQTYPLPGRLFEGGAVSITFLLEAVGSAGETLREQQIVAPGDRVVLVVPRTQ